MHSTELAAKVAADYSVRLLAAAIAMVGLLAMRWVASRWRRSSRVSAPLRHRAPADAQGEHRVRCRPRPRARGGAGGGEGEPARAERPGAGDGGGDGGRDDHESSPRRGWRSRTGSRPRPSSIPRSSSGCAAPRSRRSARPRRPR